MSGEFKAMTMPHDKTADDIRRAIKSHNAHALTLVELRLFDKGWALEYAFARTDELTWRRGQRSIARRVVWETLVVECGFSTPEAGDMTDTNHSTIVTSLGRAGYRCDPKTKRWTKQEALKPATQSEAA